jgi:carboxypeptidase C (cathepsin A)
VTHPAFESYQLRVTEPTLCERDVKQYSGYLDIAEDKHLFFWFFEARNTPEEAPLVLWMNGGPGCSSSTGLLFELGPCRIDNEGASVTSNPHSWTNAANVIFLDQPVNVGFSYADDGTSVSTSPVAAQDVYAFTQLFLSRFPQYSKSVQFSSELYLSLTISFEGFRSPLLRKATGVPSAQMLPVSYTRGIRTLPSLRPLPLLQPPLPLSCTSTSTRSS